MRAPLDLIHEHKCTLCLLKGKVYNVIFLFYNMFSEELKFHVIRIFIFVRNKPWKFHKFCRSLVSENKKKMTYKYVFTIKYGLHVCFWIQIMCTSYHTNFACSNANKQWWFVGALTAFSLTLTVLQPEIIWLTLSTFMCCPNTFIQTSYLRILFFTGHFTIPALWNLSLANLTTRHASLEKSVGWGKYFEAREC